MKNLILFFLLLLGYFSFAQDVWVNGYTKSNGTYVQGHYRTPPNSTVDDNYSTQGNVNPYTGKAGYLPRQSTSSNYNFPLIQKVLSTKQGSYDSNVSTIKYNLVQVKKSFEMVYDAIYNYKISMDIQSVRVIERDLEAYLATIGNIDFSSKYNTDIVLNNIMQFHDRLENAFNRSQSQSTEPVKTAYNEIKIGSYVQTVGTGYIWDNADFSKAKSITLVHEKQVYIMEKVNDNYYKVKYGKIIGYMMKNNLQ